MVDLMFHRVKIILLLIIGLSVAVPEIPVINQVIGVETSEAQEKRKRRSLFDLFRANRKKRKRILQNKKVRQQRANKVTKRPQRTKVRRNTKPRKPRVRNAKRQTARAPKPAVIINKNENAATIFVFGDFIATGIARELTRLYQSNPNIVIEAKTSPASGIVRDDVVNWIEEMPPILQEKKPVVLVNLLGMNDRQAMRLPNERVKELTEPWLKAYNERVEKIVGLSTQIRVPMLWVGLPPVKFSSMNTDYLTFNEIYRSKVEEANGTFIDVWDGFTNEQGKFVSAGPDVNGQIVRLRGSKGINMTRAGFRKLAFYVDQELRKLGISKDSNEILLSSLGNFGATEVKPAIPQYDPVGSGTTVVIPLGAPEPGTSNQLAGAKEFLNSEDKKNSVSFDLVEKGIGYEPRSGRIDAGWGAPKPEEAKKEKTDEAQKAKDGDKKNSPSASNDNKPQNKRQTGPESKPQAALSQ